MTDRDDEAPVAGGIRAEPLSTIEIEWAFGRRLRALFAVAAESPIPVEHRELLRKVVQAVSLEESKN
jgi:hypothetical protein